MKEKPSKNLPVRNTSTGVALSQAKSLLQLTKSVLGDRYALLLADNWLDDLIAWADENGVCDGEWDSEQEIWVGLPRDKQEILRLTGLRLANFFTSTKLPESIGHLSNLTELNLWFNQLTELPESIDNLSNLTKLNLGGNQLTELPESIGNLSNLTELDLSGNELTELPELLESIGHLSNLTELDLSDNQLTELPESLGRLQHLENINLRDNLIKELPPHLAHLKNIVTF